MSLFGVALTGLMAGCANMETARPKGGLCINEDSDNYLVSFPQEKMTVEWLEKQAGYYSSGQVDRVIYNANCMRASFDSKVIEPIWAGTVQKEDGTIWFKDKWVGETFDKCIRNLYALRDAGIDHYEVWLATIRKCGREAWISNRMNDAHYTNDPDSVMHDRLWREHPEYRLASGGAFDFAHKEVRQNKLKLIAELLDRYDMDGLELDFSRFPWYFKTPDDAPLMTELMEEARRLVNAAAKRRGHPIKLGVRIMSRPHIARRLGFDVAAWREKKLVDVVTVTNFWPCTDPAMPLEEWRELLGDEVELDAGIEIFVQAYPGAAQFVDTPEVFAGFAAQYLYRGADKIYLFNHMIGFTGMNSKAFTTINHDYSFAYKEKGMKKLIMEGGRPETVYPQSRRHVVGYATLDDQPALLPMPVNGDVQEFRLNVGGGTAGREAFAVFGFEGTVPEALEVKVNGVACTMEQATFDRRCGVAPEATRMFKLPQDVLKDGFNVVEYHLAKGEATRLLWFEIFLP